MHEGCGKAMAESFFATLEWDLLDRRRFKTRAEALIAVFEFIEGFYNPRQRQSNRQKREGGLCR